MINDFIVEATRYGALFSADFYFIFTLFPLFSLRNFFEAVSHGMTETNEVIPLLLYLFTLMSPGILTHIIN